jgi:hypothetical protein
MALRGATILACADLSSSSMPAALNIRGAGAGRAGFQVAVEPRPQAQVGTRAVNGRPRHLGWQCHGVCARATEPRPLSEPQRRGPPRETNRSTWASCALSWLAYPLTCQSIAAE